MNKITLEDIGSVYVTSLLINYLNNLYVVLFSGLIWLLISFQWLLEKVKIKRSNNFIHLLMCYQCKKRTANFIISNARRKIAVCVIFSQCFNFGLFSFSKFFFTIVIVNFSPFLYLLTCLWYTSHHFFSHFSSSFGV